MAHLIPFDYRFGYEKLERIDTSTGRVYVAPSGVHVASVTTILDKTKDKSTLDAWVARVGQAEADRIKEEAAFVGTRMHETIEAFLADAPLSLGQDWLSLRGHEMAFRLINTYFSQVTKVYGSEINLHYADQYAGTTDLVAQYRGRLAIVDFKQSLKPKRHEYITDYFHQLAAYAIAHDEMFGTNIDFAAVLVAVQDGTTQEFTTTGREFQEFKAGWMKRLNDYLRLRNL